MCDRESCAAQQPVVAHALVCGPPLNRSVSRPANKGVTSMRAFIVALTLLILGACSPTTPEYVYVRTSSVIVTVTAQSDSRVQVGEWLRLRATRAASGEWKKVRLADVPEGAPWIGYIPPEHEPEVAANLRWFAEPMDGVEFDATVPRPVSLLERAVRFAKPGTYRLWATSHAPLDATSNTLQIVVTPN